MAILARYYQPGSALDYINNTVKTINAGTVIDLKTRIAIAASDIAPGQRGAIEMEGVWIFPKTAGSGEIKLGAPVYFDGTGITGIAGSSTPAGYATADASDEDTEVTVKLLG